MTSQTTNNLPTTVRLILSTILYLWAAAAISDSSWQGYINDKGQLGEKYGYIETASHTAKGKLRLTCYPPLGFRMYLNEALLASGPPDQVTFRVDRLTEHSFPVYQDGSHYFISDRSEGFWDLVAQLIAGITLKVQVSESVQASYSLRGFSNIYNSNCGWISDAENYRQFISRYR